MITSTKAGTPRIQPTRYLPMTILLEKVSLQNQPHGAAIAAATTAGSCPTPRCRPDNDLLPTSCRCVDAHRRSSGTRAGAARTCPIAMPAASETALRFALQGINRRSAVVWPRILAERPRDQRTRSRSWSGTRARISGRVSDPRAEVRATFCTTLSVVAARDVGLSMTTGASAIAECRFWKWVWSLELVSIWRARGYAASWLNTACAAG